MRKLGRLDIDWQEFNRKIDNQQGFHKQITDVVWDTRLRKYEQDYKVDDHFYTLEMNQYTEWLSDDLTKIFPDDFYETCRIEKRVLAKVLEYLPGHVNMPHKDGYHYVSELFGLDRTKTRMKRIWIACQDHKFGHVVCQGNTIISDYKAGDIYDIPGGEIHCAGNIGVEKRRIITVTGASTDDHGYKGVEEKF